MPSPSESVVTAFFHANRAQAKKRGMPDGLADAIAEMVAAEDERGAAHEPDSLPWWWATAPLADIGLPVRPWVRRRR